MSTALKIPTSNSAASARKAVSGVTRMVASQGKAKGKVAYFTFGSATLKASEDPEEWRRNIDLGRQAMKKLKTKLIKPGVKLRTSKSAPLFRTDPSNPRQLIRVLEGKEERGVFEGGVFKVRA